MVSTRFLLALAFCVVAANGLSVPTDAVEKSFYDILPDEIKTFYESLTENDIKTFDSFENSTMSNQQIYDEIKKKDSVLSQKIDTMAKAIGDKMNAMSDVPRDYLKSIVDELKNAKNTDPDQFSEEFAATLGKAEKLPQSAINEIVKAFPSLKVFFDEEKATTK